MKIVAVSDTHCHEPVLPEGDVLVHAGDLTISGSRKETEAAVRWLGREAKKYKWVVCIGGNHDFFLYHAGAKVSRQFIKQFGKENIVYLQDEGTCIDGVNFWGSPWQPWFMDWAWNAQRGPDIKRYWDMIDGCTDVLVTHGPPKNILDWAGPERVGCEELASAVRRIKPTAHIFGHIHSPGGRSRKDPMLLCNTDFYNAALTKIETLTGDDDGVERMHYVMAHEPHVIEI